MDPTTIQTLCAVCESLEYDDREKGTTSTSKTFATKHHSDFEDLKTSSSNGCWFCRLLLAGFTKQRMGKQQTPRSGSQIKLRTILDSRWKREIGHHVLIDWGNICASIGGGDEVVYVLKNASPENRIRCPEWSSDIHTGSEANFRLAKQWLETCLSSHSSCPRAKETDLPTRVLDVGPSDGSESPVLRATDGMRDTYIALSHCWGQVQPLTTTIETIEDRMACIPFASLPKTFRDAVVVARNMGVRYLWIDSLCIVQDSPVDWETESAKMGDYFSKCLFAIASTDASDSSQGCFRYRDPWANEPSVMSLRLPHIGVKKDPLSTSSIYDWPAGKRKVHITPQKTWSRTPVIFPLAQRAWTLQETFLAPRTLHYERTQLAWTCKAGGADENKIEIEQREASRKDWTRLLIDGESSRWTSPQTIFSNWYAMIEQYTARSITKERDILPAISGLASRFQKLSVSKYLAGMWDNDLSRGLLWIVKGDIRHGDQRYRAPSWSWASINLTSISYEKCPKPDTQWRSDWFQIKAVSVEIPTKNPFGEVDGGVLEVTARLRGLETKPPVMFGRKDAFEYRRAQLTDPLTSENTGTIFFDEPRGSNESQSIVWCLPVFNWSAHDGNVGTVGLALVLVDEGTTSRYRRIGLVETKDQKWNRDAFSNCPSTSFCII